MNVFDIISNLSNANYSKRKHSALPSYSTQALDTFAAKLFSMQDVIF